jgi:hypothetical protein
MPKRFLTRSTNRFREKSLAPILGRPGEAVVRGEDAGFLVQRERI